jgi:hypothetical protein
MKFRLDSLRAVAATLVLLAPTGCETVPMEPSPDFVPDMVVATDYAQFFKLGPQQAGGADFSLRAGETVMLQRKEFGYSRVQLENNLVGYMANEDITPAPPQEKLKPGKRKTGDRTGSTSRPRSRSAPEPEDFEDLPISDLNLDILPEDIPLEPLPDLLPEPTPQAPAPAPAPAPQPTPIKEGIPETDPGTAPVSTST